MSKQVYLYTDNHNHTQKPKEIHVSKYHADIFLKVQAYFCFDGRGYSKAEPPIEMNINWIVPLWYTCEAAGFTNDDLYCHWEIRSKSTSKESQQKVLQGRLRDLESELQLWEQLHQIGIAPKVVDELKADIRRQVEINKLHEGEE